jgi:hypothetical protein
MASSQELLLGTGTAVNQYQIQRSLRFNSADSAYLNRTLGSGDRKTWTWSGWVKRAALSNDYGGTLISCATGTSDGNSGYFWFYADAIRFQSYNTQFITTTAVYRDVSAWYHIVLAVDTTQATASNRIKLYVNGTQVTAFAATNYPAQNTDLSINSANSHTIGLGDGVYSNFYLTNINFIDGQALTPSSFGETNADTGVWQPKAYSGTFGTNGFQLLFADNSGTTSTTLGKDTSGNGNNWTPNNFSVTAGAGNDSLVDTPTPYGTDTGAGGEVRGNYCTWNPLDRGSAITLTNGNLDIGSASNPNNNCRGTFGMSSGKWYFEVVITSAVGGTPAFGIGSDTASLTSNFSGAVYLYLSNGTKAVNGVETAYGATFTQNDVIGVAFDADNNSITFYKNNSSQGAITGVTSGLTWRPFVHASITATITVNFGQRPFAYTAPSGFKALCTQNLPTPTIGATSTTQADNYFNVVTRTFTAATAVITGLGFSPDWLWFKRRNTAASHSLYDRLRGTNARLLTNGTNEEITTTSAELTSFDSDGFTIGSDPGSISINSSNGDTGVVWCWRANGAGSINNAGSIQSTVSANTTADFSVVTYTGNNTLAQSVGHGLGAAPSMIIVKSRSNATNWLVWHSAISIDSTLLLNDVSAVITGLTGIWGSALPTSTTFGLNRLDTDNNRSGQTYVAYCFAPVAGYSAFGSYVGNGSTDGTFVYTGFRPKFVMVKNTSATSYWQINDTARNPYNLANLALHPNVSDAEATYSNAVMDILSNGFKLRGNDTYTNTNTNVYIYAAFAENPFKYSLAR